MTYETVLPHRLNRAVPEIRIGYPDNAFPINERLLANVKENLANNRIFQTLIINAKK